MSSLAKNMLRGTLLVAMSATLASCAGLKQPQGPRSYYALGNDPGWTLEIGRRIKFAAAPDSTYVDVPHPGPAKSLYGWQYATHRIIVDVEPGVCVDDRSGIAFEDTVRVVTSSLIVRGCGGKRVPLLKQ